MKKIIGLTVVLVLVLFTLGQAEGQKGKFDLFVKAGKATPWDDSYQREVKTGSVFGTGIGYYFTDAFSLGFIFDREWFEHKNWDLPNLNGQTGPASLYTDWHWNSYSLSGRYLLKTDGHFWPYLCLNLGWYHLQLQHTLVDKSKITHSKDYVGFSPGMGLQFSVGKGFFFLETDYNVILNQTNYQYPEIWFGHDQKEATQLLRLILGVGFRF